jgi:hypothetical protein
MRNFASLSRVIPAQAGIHPSRCLCATVSQCSAFRAFLEKANKKTGIAPGFFMSFNAFA